MSSTTDEEFNQAMWIGIVLGVVIGFLIGFIIGLEKAANKEVNKVKYEKCIKSKQNSKQVCIDLYK